GFLYGMRDREMFLNLLEIPSGGRLLYNYVRIGGVKRDLPPGFAAKAERVMQTLEQRLKEYEDLYDNSKIFRMRTDDVGCYSASDAINWGITGPNLRSAGVAFDLRQADSYDAYPELDFTPVTTSASDGISDCFSRYRQRIDEMYQSMDLIRQALAKMPEGEVMADSVPVRASGEAFRRTEDSRGEALMY
ncbi:MAG TPA: NADH-quinone oxidoreductase subunit D, partial [Candidatus Poseidoniia archaeon]|nr:NADH-quinone oxidoreductase subunit D [Candidatus Poseidoniia archaeon]